jgi:hypothetical protein
MKAAVVINVGFTYFISSVMFVALSVLGVAQWADVFEVLPNDAYWPLLGNVFLAAFVAAICLTLVLRP